MLWSHLARAELPEAEWIIAEDFNNIEDPRDKQGGSNKTSMSTRELEAWTNLLTRLGVGDAFNIGAFSRKTTKAFTWSNARMDNTMIQSRIHMFYVPGPVEIIGGTTRILPLIPDLSDHAGVLLHFNNEGRVKARQPNFNKGLLLNEESKAALLATWREVMTDPTLSSWNQKIVMANKAMRQKSVELTRAQKKKWKAAYLAQFDDIIEAEEELQRNWGSQEARDKLSDAQAILHEVCQQKFQFQESTILSKWTRVGDRCTKEFFEHHAGTRKPIIISQMLDGERTISSQVELEAHILAFYEQLYSRDEAVENNEAARQDCFQYVRSTVTEEQNAELLQPLTVEEVSIAMKQLPAGKSTRG